MAGPARLANRTIWAIEDITANARRGRKAWQKAIDRAKAQMDPVMLLALNEIGAALATIEAKSRAARKGEYEE